MRSVVRAMNKKRKIRLDYESIGAMVDWAEGEIEKAGVESGQRLRFRLSLEEMLLYVRDHCTEEEEVVLGFGRRGRQLNAELILPKECTDDGSTETDCLAALRNLWKKGPQKNSRVYTLQIEGTLFGTLKFIWKYTKPFKGWLYLGIVVHILRAVVLIITPLIAAQVIVSITQNAIEQIMLSAGSLLLISVISGTVTIVCNLTYNHVYNKTLSLLEGDLVHHVLKITTGSLGEKGAGVFIQRLTQDTSQLATSLSTLIVVLSQFFEKIGILVAILIMNRIVFLVVAGILIIQIIIESVRTRTLKADDFVLRNAEERYTGLVSEMIYGAADVKLTNSEYAFEKELKSRIEDANGKRLKMWNRSAIFDISRLQLDSVGTYAFIMVLVLLLSRGSIEPASAIVLFNYRSGIEYTAIQLLGSLMQLIRETEISTKRIISLIQGSEFDREYFGTKHLEPLKGRIRFEHVYFSYDAGIPGKSSHWVLKDLDFVIHPGETIAIVGSSGCGKSTVFKLISKLYEASNGTVYIDDIDVKELDAETLRGRITVVNQLPYIFHLSVRDNLRLIKPEMTEEEMRAVCKMACVDRDIEEKPEGYDSVLGENGVDLSGGQRQRLAIARAFLNNSDILMLDESTSALDNITQAQIFQTIRENWRGRTVIMIAHRLSTVITADRILFMEKGRILDMGTHQELLGRCAPYKKLYETETLGNGEDDGEDER